jgi:(1->4)-alpha-D-glucan 1-alpha-D-glucosylmutase
MKDFATFQGKISYFGMFNALSQTVLKIASPGIPDFYQGSEIWDFSLADPDNRRPVDFAVRRRMLKRMAVKAADRASLARGLFRAWQDGAIKLYVTFMSLNYRKENRLLFENGGYLPVMADGSLKENVCAFARLTGDKAALVVVPRFLTRPLKGGEEMPFGEHVWKDTGVMIPDEIPGDTYRNIFTGEVVTEIKQDGKRTLRLGEVFASFPVALLEKQVN